MKAWLVILVLGVGALLAGIGSAMVALRFHHTIGLGVVGLGIVIALAGLFTAFRPGKSGKTGIVETQPPSKKKSGFLKPVLAILVVVGIGIATFYGTSYLTSVQPGGQSSSPGTGSITVSGSTIESSGASGSSTASIQSPTIGASTIVVTVSTKSPTTQSSSSQSVSTESSTSQTSTSVSSTSQSLSSSQSVSTQSSASVSSSSASSTSQSQSSSQSSSSSSQSFTSSGNFPFVLSAKPTIVLNGENITISADYANQGATARTVNFYMDLRFTNGTVYQQGSLFYPKGPQVSPGNHLPISANLGPFAHASYVITFYVVEYITDTQLSDSVTATFTTP